VAGQVPAPLSGWLHEKPWKEARWCNRLDAGRRRAPELRIFLAVLVAAP
jgi:hypothetical protein